MNYVCCQGTEFAHPFVRGSDASKESEKYMFLSKISKLGEHR